MTQDESSVLSALTGFSLDHVLSSLDLPKGADLNNRLGISGLPSLDAKQIYNDRFDSDEEEAIGLDAGKDWEDEVDREIEDEEDEDEVIVAVKDEAQSPEAFLRQRRTRIVKRVVERPKSVYERFPAFEQGKVLDFTELFKGNIAKKSRVGKRQPFLSKHKK
jgi:transcription initiation factor TFIID subunit 1, fungi type